MAWSTYAIRDFRFLPLGFERHTWTSPFPSATLEEEINLEIIPRSIMLENMTRGFAYECPSRMKRREFEQNFDGTAGLGQNKNI